MEQPHAHILIECQDKVHEQFDKLTALINVANTDDFLEFDPPTLKNYLWLLKDLVLDCETHLNAMEQALISAETNSPV
jgi:hypothetical protein